MTSSLISGRPHQFALVLLIGVIGCAAPTDGAGDKVGVAQAPLYADSARFWPKHDIEVCWLGSGFETEKAWVKSAVLYTWGAASGLVFYGWHDCPAGTGASTGAGLGSNFPGIRVVPSTTTTDQTLVFSGVAPSPGYYPTTYLDFSASPQNTYPRCTNNKLNREGCIRATAIHEFGHAIGFEHEQQRSTTPTSCSFTQYYRSGGGDYTFGDYDANSVMNYCTPKAVPSNTDYGGIVDIYGPEVGAPIQQRTSGMCIVPVGYGAPFQENTLAMLDTACLGEDGRAYSAMELTQSGLLRSTYSGMCLVPEGGGWPQNNTRLVFTSACAPVPILGMFHLTPSGSFQHLLTGMCVHPSGGSATPARGTPLVLYTGCDEPRLQYKGYFNGPARIGHISGLCVHPEGGSTTPSDGTRAVLWNECRSIGRTDFVMRSSGSIQHVSSGKCLHPSGGSANPANGTEVVFWGACDETRLAFELTARGSLRHVASGKCLHPSGGSADPAVGTKLVFYDGCNEERLRFGAVYW